MKTNIFRGFVEDFIEKYYGIINDREYFCGRELVPLEQIEMVKGFYSEAPINKRSYERLYGFEFTDSEWRTLAGQHAAIRSKINTAGGEKECLDKLSKDLTGRQERLQKRCDKKELKLANGFGGGQHDYDKYLLTAHWRGLRAKRLVIDGNRCKLCNDDKNLQTHHRSYKAMWLPDEEINDLIIICKRCHSLFHKYLKIQKS